MNEQEKFWAGEFGNAYTDRNQVDWRARIPFWHRIIELTGARSVHEVGCNCGWNLSAIHRVFPDVKVSGNDFNVRALQQAGAAGFDVFEGHGVRFSELVFTAGVLIHVGPQALDEIMQRIVDSSYRYVLAVEYEDIEEVEVEYRGHAGKLWRRPYGALYEALGLKTIWREPNAPGFDDCTAVLLEKQS